MGGPTGSDKENSRGLTSEQERARALSELGETQREMDTGGGIASGDAGGTAAAAGRNQAIAEAAAAAAAAADEKTRGNEDVPILKTQPLLSTQPEPPPPPPETETETEEDLTEAERAAAKRRKGRKSTILTGGGGLLSPASVARKTLLGQ